MGIVVDSSLLIALAVNDDRATNVESAINRWIAEDQSLYAPYLLQYEVANGLTRLVAAGLFPSDDIRAAWSRVGRIPIAYRPIADGAAVVSIASQLRRSSAYDASYVALARELDASLWTLDGPLYRNASALGYPVNLIST